MNESFRKPFRAVPLRRREGQVVPFKRPGRARRWRSPFAITLVALPLAAFAAVFVWDGPPPALALPFAASFAPAADEETAFFGQCAGPVRTTCVVDGDTFWLAGEKIRIADINTPETSEPGCAHEAELGARATRRLVDLLNAGPFSLESIDRDTDAYGRALRVVTREGESLGEILIAEGLAEPWRGRRSGWC